MLRVPSVLLVVASAWAGVVSFQEPPSATRSCSVIEVVDGDTLKVSLDGRVETLRLACTDTEEKIRGRPLESASKPETLFGEETALWAKDFFASLSKDGEPARVELLLPAGPQRDVYGRLLCHVILADGSDFNLLLVERGFSPYFNKYGNCEVRHADFLRAQDRARAKKLGIWDPQTNRARTPGAPEARRPYEMLLPWWDARAEAVEGFRRSSTEDPLRFLAADDPAALEAALQRCLEDPALEVEVFGEIDRIFEEHDGSLTFLFRSGDPKRAFRAVLSPAQRPPHHEGALEQELRDSMLEFRQNYLSVLGRLVAGSRGPTMKPEREAAWRLAGREPVLGAK